MDLGIADKVAVVTGASSGIGLETCRRLTEEGAKVLMVALDEDRLARAAGELGAEYIAADVTDPDCDARIVATAEEQIGEVDILVNNAGFTIPKPLLELDDRDWQAQFEISVQAPRRLMACAAPLMAARGWGRIVNVSSSAGKRPSQRDAAYAVLKAAELSLSRVYADAFAASGVLINAVAPGPTLTGIWTDPGGLIDQVAANAGIDRDAALARERERQPLGRLLEPREIADVIAVLCSERASAVAGAAWSVDGGTFQSII